MSGEATARHRMTLEEFYDWEGAPETRYELIDGVPIAMTPPSVRHGAIVARLARHISERLDARPTCMVITEAGILSPRSSNTWYQADLALSCCEQDSDGHDLQQPLLIVEVLSPSTENTDRKIKLVDYRRVSSVVEVLLVDSTRPYVELHRRIDGDRWVVELIVDSEASVYLESIGAELAMATIYGPFEDQ